VPEPAPFSRSPRPVIIDTDPGIDDTIALILALQSPELEVRGLAASYGNTTVEHAYRNCVEILRRTRQRLPLAVSARRPLKRQLVVAAETHGETGLGDAPVPPAGVILDFVKPLDRLLAEQPAPVTLVTLGPVTGLALALRRDEALVRAKVTRHLAMIGNINAAGNTTPFSEFNAWCDPEALSVVLKAELPTELVGLDVTRQFVLSGSDIARLGQSSDERERWLFAALRFYLTFHREREGLDGCVLNDILPIAELLAPGTLTFVPMRLSVDLEEGDNRGRTRVDPDGARVSVATAVKTDVAHRLLAERVLTALAPARAAGMVS
jgi:inosine-uridine nucleoside N-ribohydrolase